MSIKEKAVKELVAIAAGMHGDLMLRKANPSKITEYSERMQAGAVFPPVTIGLFPHSEKYGSQAVVDGIHRILGAENAKLTSFPVNIVNYKSVTDMLADMYKLNMAHGFPVTEGQRNARIKLLLQQGMTLESVGKIFNLGKSSVDRIGKGTQGEGVSGPKKGAIRSAGQNTQKPKKPAGVHKLIQNTLTELKRKAAFENYCAFLSPATKENPDGEIDTEKVAEVNLLISVLSKVVKELS